MTLAELGQRVRREEEAAAAGGQWQLMLMSAPGGLGGCTWAVRCPVLWLSSALHASLLSRRRSYTYVQGGKVMYRNALHAPRELLRRWQANTCTQQRPLCCTAGVTQAAAEAIAARFPSPGALLRSYLQALQRARGSPAEAAAAVLGQLQCPRVGGPALSPEQARSLLRQLFPEAEAEAEAAGRGGLPGEGEVIELSDEEW